MPLAIVASVGRVATGAIDPLREIAKIAETDGLWLHTDGAFGVLAVPEQFERLNLFARQRTPGV